MSTRTTLLLPSLHCPTCLNAVTSLLVSPPLDLAQHDISISLLTKLVSFSHEPEQIDDIKQTLVDAGYEVDGASGKGQQREGEEFGTSSLGGGKGKGKARWWESRESLERKTEEEERKRWEAHRASCRACREVGEGPSTPSSSSLSEKKGHFEDMVLQFEQPKEFKTTLSVGRMTCSSCTSGVGKILRGEEGVKTVEVTLLPGRAVVTHGAEVDSKDLVEALDDGGYDGEVVETVEIEQSKTKDEGWVETKLVIEGMTCSACVGSLSAILSPSSVPGLRSANVTLLPAIATLVHNPRLINKEALIELVEDGGYGAQLLSSNPLEKQATEVGVRTVRVRVLGMFCNNCSSAINDLLSTLVSATSLSTFTPLTYNNPLTTLVYTPSQSFNLRILATQVASLGPFTLSPLPPASSTLATLSARSTALESHSLLLRLLITFLFAIPTFLIGIVFPSLLPSSHHLRQFFEQPVWGSASRGMVSLFALSTPVQFGVGWFFYERAWKGVRGVWRRSGWREKVWGWGSMDSLVALGTTVGWVTSVGLLVMEVRRTREMDGHGMMMGSGEMGYFDSSVFLMLFILFGRYLEHLTKTRTTSALSSLESLRVTHGLLLSTPSSPLTSQPIAFLEPNDTILIPVGSPVPLDSLVAESDSATISSFDESSLTGESLPVPKPPSSSLYAGSTNLGPSPVTAIVLRPAGEGLIDGIESGVREAMSRKAAIERVGERITALFVPVIVAIAIVTFVVWLGRGYGGTVGGGHEQPGEGGWGLFATQFAVAVLVVACPCGIGLAAPTAQAVGMGLAAKLGIVPYGGGEAFQNATKIDIVCFDKTGTLTKGDFTVVDHQSYLHPSSASVSNQSQETQTSTSEGVEGVHDSTLLQMISLVESGSSHPISLGIRNFCEAQHHPGEATPSQLELVSSTEIAGQGLTAIVALATTSEGNPSSTYELLIGNTSLLTSRGVSLESLPSSSGTLTLVAIRLLASSALLYTLASAFTLRDLPRPSASVLINTLHARGVATWLITGDNLVAGTTIAQQVGIPKECVVAGVLPGEKGEWVRKLQNGEGRKSIDEVRERWKGGWLWRSKVERDGARARVMFVGDGINDVVALSTADVGVSMGSGASVALSSSDFCLLSSNLLSVLTVLDLAKATFRKILTNFIWACLFNTVLIPVAAGAFYDLNRTKLPPVWAALAMALSSVSVVCNSLLLRWTFRVSREARDFEKTVQE